MAEFTIGGIEATEKNADSIIQLVKSDLQRAGLTTDEIIKYTNPNIKTQTERLSRNPERYVGVFALVGALASEELSGFMKFNDWLNGDQMPFETRLKRLQLKMGGAYLDGMPQGIHGLVVEDTLDNGVEAIRLLTDEAVKLAQGREIRIALYPGDPAEPVLGDYGFNPTGKFGELSGLRQQLYVRDGQ